MSKVGKIAMVIAELGAGRGQKQTLYCPNRASEPQRHRRRSRLRPRLSLAPTTGSAQALGMHRGTRYLKLQPMRLAAIPARPERERAIDNGDRPRQRRL